MEFKIGDMVICVNTECSWSEKLILNEIYCVIGFNGDSDLILEGCDYSWNKVRFRQYAGLPKTEVEYYSWLSGPRFIK